MSVEFKLSTQPRPPLTSDQIKHDVEQWALEHPEVELTFDPDTGVFKIVKGDKLYRVDMIGHHQLEGGSCAPDNDSCQILYRHPVFLDWIAQNCPEANLLAESSGYNLGSRLVVSKGQLEVIFKGHEDLDPKWHNTFPLSDPILRHAHNRRQFEAAGVGYGLLGTDHVESVAQRLDNLLEFGYCDRHMSGGHRGSNVILTIQHILAEQGYSFEGRFDPMKRMHAL